MTTYAFAGYTYKPHKAILILFTNTVMYYLSLVWKQFWESKTRIFNAPVNE